MPPWLTHRETDSQTDRFRPVILLAQPAELKITAFSILLDTCIW